MYKKILLVIPLLVVLLSITNVYAASFDLDLIIDQTTVTKDEELIVKLSNNNLSSDGLSSGQFYITYDKDYYNFSCDDVTFKQNVTSQEIDCNTQDDQIIIIYIDEDGGDTPILNGEFLNLKFNVKKGVDVSTPTTFLLSGEGFASVSENKIIELNSNANVSKTVSIEKTKSSDIYLKNLSVEGYDIGFLQNKFEYSIEVNNEVSQININATTNTSTSSVENAGTKELVVGDNKFILVVTAEDGTTQNYIINVKRKDVAEAVIANPQTGVNHNITALMLILVVSSIVMVFLRKKNLFPKI